MACLGKGEVGEGGKGWELEESCLEVDAVEKGKG